MKLWFRAAQSFGVFAIIGVWAWKWFVHREHPHLNVLLIAVTWVVASELGFHVGRSSKDL